MADAAMALILNAAFISILPAAKARALVACSAPEARTIAVCACATMAAFPDARAVATMLAAVDHAARADAAALDASLVAATASAATAASALSSEAILTTCCSAVRTVALASPAARAALLPRSSAPLRTRAASAVSIRRNEDVEGHPIPAAPPPPSSMQSSIDFF
jgi:hypothetical protein